ncbi:MAG: neutral/alkaline non-lysosomal ceramidase N-terminal domain-containing protein [Thermoleophilaceae bacterium]
MRRAVSILVILTALGAAAPASAAQLYAGAARADITPPTGYYMMGWVRVDAKVTGQHTRLWARVIVLRQGDKKLALIAGDLNAWPGGLVKQAAEMNKDRGFSEDNVLVSASHTHAAPTGFYNFGTYNTVFMTAKDPAEFKIADTAADPQLYTFMVRQLAAAIRRADDDLAPAALGWGFTQVLGLTANRSIEAHLADFGIHVPFGQGSVFMDPGGYPDTIDPEVNVLRVDQLKDGKHVPIGMWSTFADHGTVNKYTFHYYNEDHHGAATSVVERKIRRLGHVPRSQDVVNVYGNSDEGDMSAGLTRDGPAAADYVGRVEAAAMLRAWREAGRSMTSDPTVDSRWTRVCFCGQQGSDTHAVVGLPLFTGSEEGRGPLYDETHVPFEGRTGPERGAQGDKVQTADNSDSVPGAVPLMATRIGDRMIVSVPGEMTVEMGRRVRAAVLDATHGAGVTRAIISGLANEYLQYFTTPEEYEWQAYEGGSTLYGTNSSLLLQFADVDLAKALVDGQPAPKPYDYDPTNGVKPDGPPYPPGADAGKATAQPKTTPRLRRAQFSWSGGPRGEDRPLDRAFVTVQKLRKDRRHRHWHHVTSDLGLQILWDVDKDGVYTARWEVPLGAKLGSYRFVVTANRYHVASKPFKLAPSGALTSKLLSKANGRAVVQLAYPQPVPNEDLTYRPGVASGGVAKFVLNDKLRTVKVTRGGRFVVTGRPGDAVRLPAGAGRDRFGNRTQNVLGFSL